MKETGKKITGALIMLVLALVLSSFVHARPWTDTLGLGLRPLNGFFENEQYRLYSKVIDFVIFSGVFILVLWIGGKFAFKEMKRQEKSLIVIVGLTLAFLFVAADWSIMALAPYIHWVFYFLLFTVYWWILGPVMFDIKNRFWRFVLALLLTLLTVGLMQGLFEAFTPPQFEGPDIDISKPDTGGISGFFKSFFKDLGGVEIPGVSAPGVPDYAKDWFGIRDKLPSVTTDPTLTEVTTPPDKDGDGKPDEGTGEGGFMKNNVWWMIVLFVLALLGFGGRLGGRALRNWWRNRKKKGEDEGATGELNIQKIIDEINKIIELKKKVIKSITDVIERKKALTKNFLDVYHKMINDRSFDPAFLLDMESKQYKELAQQSKEVIDLLVLELKLEEDLIKLREVEEELTGNASKKGKINDWDEHLKKYYAKFEKDTKDAPAWHDEIKDKISKVFDLLIKGKEGLLPEIKEIIARFFILAKKEEEAEKQLKQITDLEKLKEWLKQGKYERWKSLQPKLAEELKIYFEEEEKVFFEKTLRPKVNLEMRYLQLLRELLKFLESERKSITQLQELHVAVVDPHDATKWIDVDPVSVDERLIAYYDIGTQPIKIFTNFAGGIPPFNAACYVDAQKKAEQKGDKAIPKRYDTEPVLKFFTTPIPEGKTYGETEIGVLLPGRHVISILATSPKDTYRRLSAKKIVITIRATGPPPPPQLPTITFIATPDSIQQGESSTLEWDITNAANAAMFVNGVSHPIQMSGRVIVTPASTTLYEIKAENQHGHIFGQVTVTVSPPSFLKVRIENPKETTPLSEFHIAESIKALEALATGPLGDLINSETDNLRLSFNSGPLAEPQKQLLRRIVQRAAGIGVVDPDNIILRFKWKIIQGQTKQFIHFARTGDSVQISAKFNEADAKLVCELYSHPGRKTPIDSAEINIRIAGKKKESVALIPQLISPAAPLSILRIIKPKNDPEGRNPFNINEVIELEAEINDLKIPRDAGYQYGWFRLNIEFSERKMFIGDTTFTSNVKNQIPASLLGIGVHVIVFGLGNVYGPGRHLFSNAVIIYVTKSGEIVKPDIKQIRELKLLTSGVPPTAPVAAVVEELEPEKEIELVEEIRGQAAEFKKIDEWAIKEQAKAETAAKRKKMSEYKQRFVKVLNQIEKERDNVKKMIRKSRKAKSSKEISEHIAALILELNEHLKNARKNQRFEYLNAARGIIYDIISLVSDSQVRVAHREGKTRIPSPRGDMGERRRLRKEGGTEPFDVVNPEDAEGLEEYRARQGQQEQSFNTMRGLEGFRPVTQVPEKENVVIRFEANPTRINLGQTSTLTWTITGAGKAEMRDSYTNAPSEINMTGSMIVQPRTTTSYHIDALSPRGTARAGQGVIVEVIQQRLDTGPKHQHQPVTPSTSAQLQESKEDLTGLPDEELSPERRAELAAKLARFGVKPRDRNAPVRIRKT